MTMLKHSLLPLLLFLCACTKADPNEICCLQLTHRDGLEETISDKGKLKSYRGTDFTQPQNFMRVIKHKKNSGQRESCIMTYHDNGSLAALLEIKNSRAHGKFYQYHDNGVLYIQSNVTEGKADLSDEAKRSFVFEGPVKIFDQASNLITKMYYKLGRLEGALLDYWQNGAIKSKSLYTSGKLEDRRTFYNKEGQLIGEKNYHDGVKQGLSKWDMHYTEHYENGLLITGHYTNSFKVENGNGVKPYFQNQKLVRTVQIQNGLENGEQRLFSPSGHLINKFTMINGKKEGLESCYFDNNNKELELQIPWLEDEIHGMVKTYYQNQKLETQTEMVKNKKCGLSITYYDNGALMMMETYKKGKLIQGKYYPINDTTLSSSIENGSGLATIYTKSGELLRTIQYKNSVIQMEEDE
jgi:antitoxin component YwqK of YwqJK toxin-antitoxin module